MSIQQFSRGRAVYGQGSYAPTRGQVSAQGAQGYLKRELGKKGKAGVSSWGRDGQSDTRSGVAKAALGRKDAASKGRPQLGGIRPPLTGPNTSKGGQVGQPGGPDRETGGTRPPIQPGQPGGGGSAPDPVVEISENGQLKLPYNQQYGESVLGALQDSNSSLLDIQSQQQQQALQYMQANRDVDTQYTGLKRNTLSDNAGRGTAFSSGYGLAVGNDATMYNNTKNDLASQNTQINNTLDLQRAGIYDAFNDTLRQGALSYGNSLTEQAGNLGYGTDNNPIKGGDTGKGNPGGGKGRNSKKKKQNKKDKKSLAETAKKYRKKGGRW